MKIGEAIEEMRANRKVKRPGWGQSLSLAWEGGKPVKILKTLETRGAEEPQPSPIILAEDWMIA